MRYEQAVFEFPELLRKIHIISVRIFKSLYLTPEKLYLLFAECLYFFEIRRVINELSVFKHLYLEFFASVVSQKLYETLTGIQMGRLEAPEGWIRKML